MIKPFLYHFVGQVSGATPTKQVDLDRNWSFDKAVKLKRILITHQIQRDDNLFILSQFETANRWLMFWVDFVYTMTSPTIVGYNAFDNIQGDTATIQNYIRFHASQEFNDFKFNNIFVPPGIRIRLHWEWTTNSGAAADYRTQVLIEFDEN